MHKKIQILLLLIILPLFTLIAYFGYNTVKNEKGLRQLQLNALGTSHVNQIEQFLIDFLDKKQIQLSAIGQYLDINPTNIRQFIKENSDIKQIFVIEQHNLLIPDSNLLLSNQEKQFISQIQAIVNDPSLLTSQQFNHEGLTLDSGWFLANNNQGNSLIYWQKNQNKLIGFELSYIKLLADIIANLNPDYPNAAIQIYDGSQLLYHYGSEALTQLPALTSKTLSHPLSNWHINYFTKNTDNSGLNQLIILIVFAIVVLISLSAIYLYRETTRSIRLAGQQVQFVSQVSHELKTPLTNISLYAEMLKEQECEENSQNSHYLNVITHESKRLSRLIQNVLNFSKTPSLNRQSIYLPELIQSLVTTFSPALLTKGITINNHVNTKITLNSDIDMVTQILSNFISNAEKYASEGKYIDIISADNPTETTISIRDYGPGISKSEQRHIFKAFYRIKSSLNEGISGTGIGLTIAKQLADNLHAKISVHSHDVGTTFSLTLPHHSSTEK